MKNKYQRLASIFMLAALPLFAEQLSEGEEIALETQETAQFGNRRITPISAKAKQDCSKQRCRDCNDPVECAVTPEELLIGDQKGIITPSVFPYVSCGANIYATIDFLWWQSILGGTGYAYNGTADGSTETPLGTNESRGELHRPDYGFSPGFKIGLGGHFDHDGWTVGAEFTYLPSSGDDSIDVCDDNDTICGDLVVNGAKTNFNITTGDGINEQISIVEGFADWKQNFMALDFTLGRNFFISKYLTLYPHVGFKAAWITERIRYDFGPTPQTVDPRDPDGIVLINQVTDSDVYKRQHVYGVGIRGGLDTMWHITKNWAFYGDLSLTSFWAHFHVKNYDTVTETLEGEYTTKKLNYNVVSVIPVIETGIGLAYISWFSDNRFRLQVQLGWETQIWTEFNYFTQDGFGSLAMQGMTVKAGLTF